jgi:hypothetical protein
MVPLLSSAAKMPLPAATNAPAVTTNSSTVIRTSPGVWTPYSIRLRPL